MGEIFPNKGDEPGDSKKTAMSGEEGSYRITGDLRVDGDTRFDGTVTLGTVSILDVFESEVYTLGDPILRLNTLFAGAYVEGAGVAVARGGVLPDARIFFIENPERTLLEWRAGLETDMLRLARIADDALGGRAMYWDVAASALGSYAAMSLGVDAITTSTPIQTRISTGGGNGYIRHDDGLSSTFSVERSTAGVRDAGIDIGFDAYTLEGVDFTGLPQICGDGALMFLVVNQASPRNLYVFDGGCNLGMDTDNASLIRTGANEIRIEGVVNVGLRAGTTGNDQLLVAADKVEATVDVDYGAQKLTGLDASITAVGTEAITFEFNAGFVSYPVFAGSDTITYDGVTSTISAAQVSARMSYEVRADHTILVGSGAPYTVYIPINIGDDMINIRGMHGVVRKMNGAVVERVYGIPPGDMSIEEPFDVDPPAITALKLAGFQLLSVRMMSVTGEWSILVTIDAGNALLHAP